MKDSKRAITQAFLRFSRSALIFLPFNFISLYFSRLYPSYLCPPLCASPGMMSVMRLEMEQEGRDIPPASGRAVEVEEDEEGRKGV